MIVGIVVVLAVLGVSFWLLGWRWERTVKRPLLSSLPSLPLVSILIPSYQSEGSITDTLKSVKALDYPHTEIIVTNDSEDNTPQICRRLGVRCVQSPHRMGKARALNAAVKQARGSILFFVDADTVVAPDTLTKLLPWFSHPSIAAVAPRYVIKNPRTFLSQLISIEHSILSTFFKIHMFFGSMLTFRGCGIAIRRDVFDAQGGWPHALIEDVEFSTTLLKNGYTIQYEPQAIIHTDEPETASALQHQRFRWGKGSTFSFVHNHHALWKKPQFLLYFYPYIVLAALVLTFLFYQSLVVTLPVLSLFILYTFSIKEFGVLILAMLAVVVSTTFAAVVTGSVAHLMVLAFPDSFRRHNPLLILPFLFYFMPITMFAYLRGMRSGASDLRHKRGDLNLNDW